MSIVKNISTYQYDFTYVNIQKLCFIKTPVSQKYGSKETDLPILCPNNQLFILLELSYNAFSNSLMLFYDL